ncbi:MAG: hypothetical protein WBD95_19495 [Xanthobacteraceae bacterium]
MRYEMPLPKRLLTKVVHDVLPAALASIIGGFLFTHLQLGWGQERVAAPAAPASAEMMQLLRDEHGLIVSFVRARIADEKKQLTANANAGDGAAEPQPGASPAGSRPSAVAIAAAKAHGKHPLTGAALLIGRVQQHEENKSAVEDHSLLARTIGIKDHVVAVTQRVVSAIGGIPTWIGAIGDRIGGEDPSPRPPANLVSAS